jgi:acetylornithine deacetylase/succinyl-diaminopimelate desuccinylase-like protein
MPDEVEAVTAKINESAVVELAKQLVSIPSPTGEEADIAEFVAEWLEDAGVRAQLQTIEEGRYNAVGRIPGASGRDGTSLSFNAHLDTSQGSEYDEIVYGEQSQEPTWKAEPREKNGRLYGAGMMNDKGPMAAFLIAAKAIADAGITLADTGSGPGTSSPTGSLRTTPSSRKTPGGV